MNDEEAGELDGGHHDDNDGQGPSHPAPPRRAAAMQPREIHEALGHRRDEEEHIQTNDAGSMKRAFENCTTFPVDTLPARIDGPTESSFYCEVSVPRAGRLRDELKGLMRPAVTIAEIVSAISTSTSASSSSSSSSKKRFLGGIKLLMDTCKFTDGQHQDQAIQEAVAEGRGYRAAMVQAGCTKVKAFFDDEKWPQHQDDETVEEQDEETRRKSHYVRVCLRVQQAKAVEAFPRLPYLCTLTKNMFDKHVGNMVNYLKGKLKDADGDLLTPPAGTVEAFRGGPVGAQ